MKTIAMVFSKPKDYKDPFSPLGSKRPVYKELIKKLSENGIEMVICSKKGYEGNGIFSWYWKLENGKIKLYDQKTKVNLAYDRSGGLKFPLENDTLKVVDNLDFKKLAWNKWLSYEILGEFMPKTFLLEENKNPDGILNQIKTSWVVLKPVSGLKGKGIYVGPKNDAKKFKRLEGKDYLVQEFVDTTKGIETITDGRHDLRVVVINGKIIWSHVRIPPLGQYKANVAEGAQLKEIDISQIPEMITNIVHKVSQVLYNRFDNPIYSIDFGVDEKTKPYIFEINDQMGFPTPLMQAKNLFLSEMILNFKSKL